MCLQACIMDTEVALKEKFLSFIILEMLLNFKRQILYFYLTEGLLEILKIQEKYLSSMIDSNSDLHILILIKSF